MARPTEFFEHFPEYEVGRRQRYQYACELAAGMRLSVECRAETCKGRAVPWSFSCRVHGGLTPEARKNAHNRRIRGYKQWARQTPIERLEQGPLWPPDPDDLSIKVRPPHRGARIERKLRAEKKAMRQAEFEQRESEHEAEERKAEPARLRSTWTDTRELWGKTEKPRTVAARIEHR